VPLATDERQPLPLGKQKNAAGRQLLSQLQKRGESRFQQIELPFTDYAHLDALQGVIGMAGSYDPAIQVPPGKPKLITDTEVIQSHHRRERYGEQALLAKVLDASFPDLAGKCAAPEAQGGAARESEGKTYDAMRSTPEPENTAKTVPGGEMLIGCTV